MKKIALIILAAVCFTKLSAQELKLGFVNFKVCLEESKQGVKEKEAFESMKNQMQASLEATDKEIEELAKKLEDHDYMDGLSPTAEEELKTRFQGLSQEFARYQNQYYQLLNQANYKMFQNLHAQVGVAAEKVRQKEDLAMILNEDSTFAFASSLDVTQAVVVEMNRRFDLENGDSNE
ncbi:MAG: OmpH family outer membrane protein [Chlamydiales bacterium]